MNADNWCGNHQHTHAFLFGYMEGSINGAKRLSQVRADLDHCKVLLADHQRVCCARFNLEADR